MLYMGADPEYKGIGSSLAYSIINELKVFNITEDFIYPDMDNVAHEIMENINK